MAETWTKTLAEFIVESEPSEAPADVRALAVRPFVDTIGCMAAGLDSAPATAVRAYTGLAHDSALAELWGTAPSALPAEHRALVGGTLGAALDFDDVSAIGHPSSILLAAILSTDLAVLPGPTVLDAYLVGYEVTTRLGQAMMLPHTRHGWHATSTTGFFGAFAVAARLTGLDVAQTMHGLGLAASMAAGIGRNFGTTTKPLHSGLAARGGLTAAGLARAGALAGADVLDGPRGYLDMYALGDAAAERLGALGAPWAMQERAPSLKRFASCYATHRPVDAMLQIQAAHDLAVEDVEEIVLRAPIRATGGLTYPRPTDGLQAKFSGTYPVAAAFLDRGVSIGSFADDQVLRPEAQALIARMDVAEDPRCLPEDPEGRNASPIEGGFWEVRVRTADGRDLVATSAEAPGSGSRQLSWGDLRAKFLDCAQSSGHSADRAGEVFDALREVDAVPDVRHLLDRLGERTAAHG